MNIQKLLETVFKIDSNTSATIVITLLVFFLGYLISSLGKFLQKGSFRKAHRRIFIRVLETLLAFIRKRREMLNDQLRHLEIETFTAVPVGKIAFYQITMLNSLNHKDLFESFFNGPENFFSSKNYKKLKNKAYVKVWENLANIELLENRAFDQMNPAQEEINRINELMGIPLKQLRIFYTELLQKLNDPHISFDEKQFLIELDIIIDNWSRIPNRTQGFVVTTYLCGEIKRLCDSYSMYPEARKLRDHAMGAIYHFENIKVVQRSLVQYLQAYDHALKFFTRSTKKIIAILC